MRVDGAESHSHILSHYSTQSLGMRVDSAELLQVVGCLLDCSQSC